ncbi:hypothetical protein F2Q70_00021684 [Brassica cretica]|uniref:Uncharacterized protein n=1 Tax=Brassica cretica TaxID=69181 RepID=A0A8S9GX59_BRACR|nr:hypothetical protein F2Q70_00021684 [Brassica cretica]
MEERLEKRCDDIYFPFDNKISELDNHAEWLQKEVIAIQRQLAAQHQISASIDRSKAKSIDNNSPRSTNKHVIASIDAESIPIGEQLIHKTAESMQKELTDLSAYAYDNIGWHQVSIDNIQERLQNISNVLGKMDDKWTRNDEATRSFIASWSRMSALTTFKKGYRTSPMYLRRWMTNGQEMMRPQEVSLHLGPECAEMTWMLAFQQAVVSPPNSQSLPQSS